jgi:hypothetical protein
MAKSITKRFVVDASPDRLLEVLTSAAFHEEHERMQEDTVEATYHEISRTDERRVFEVRCTKYGRGLTGIDRSKTEPSATRSEWDLRTRRSEWSVRMAHGDRVRVWGTNRIEPAGDGASLTTEYNVDIKVPLIGGKIEKLALSAIEARQPAFERLVRKHCAQAD